MNERTNDVEVNKIIFNCYCRSYCVLLYFDRRCRQTCKHLNSWFRVPVIHNTDITALVDEQALTAGDDVGWQKSLLRLAL